VPNTYYCTTLLCWTTPRKMCQTTAVQSALVRPCCTKKHSKQLRNLCPQTASKTMPSSLLYALYRSVQYGLLSAIISTTYKQKIFLGNVPNLPWEMCQLAALSSPQSSLGKSLNLFFSLSCTLPNAFSYNWKVTFHLPSIFSPSPSLNPKAKI
jgi:hypothetical protein